MGYDGPLPFVRIVVWGGDWVVLIWVNGFLVPPVIQATERINRIYEIRDPHTFGSTRFGHEPTRVKMGRPSDDSNYSEAGHLHARSKMLLVNNSVNHLNWWD